MRLFFAYGILFSLGSFISSNLHVITRGGGYLYLILAIMCFLALIFVNKDWSLILRFRLSFFVLMIFIGYFSGKFLLEGSPLWNLRELTIGTTGGIIFGLVVGFITSYSLYTLYNLRRYRDTYNIVYFIGIIFLLFVLKIGFDAFQTHFAAVDSEKLLVTEQKGRYQRVGNFLTILLMLVGSLSVVLTVSSLRVKLFRSLPAHILIIGIGLLFGYLSQLVGSNSGLFASMSFNIIYLAHFLFIWADNRPRDQSDLKINYVIFDGLGLKISTSAIISVALVTLISIAAIIELDIDINSMRFTGYGSGELTSAQSRAELFRVEFIEHVSYDPIFGHTKVELKTGGEEGGYIHSLLSVVTHTGLIGASIFTIFIILVYREITVRRKLRFISLYNNRHYGLFRILIIASMLVMCLVSAFFTWLPMWFAFGLLAISFSDKTIVPALK